MNQILELKNLTNEMKNAIASIGNRAGKMEERINDLEDRNIEIIRRGERTKFKKKTKMEETLQNPTKAMEFSQKGKYRNN